MSLISGRRATASRRGSGSGWIHEQQLPAARTKLKYGRAPRGGASVRVATQSVYLIAAGPPMSCSLDSDGPLGPSCSQEGRKAVLKLKRVGYIPPRFCTCGARLRPLNEDLLRLGHRLREHSPGIQRSNRQGWHSGGNLFREASSAVSVLESWIHIALGRRWTSSRPGAMGPIRDFTSTAG